MIPQRLPEPATPGSLGGREAWLSGAAVLLRPWFAARGFEVPLRLRVGVGALGVTRRVLGIYFPETDADGFRHITVSPFIDDGATVVVVLVHELIHAILPPEALHGPVFREAAERLGLRPPYTVISASGELLEQAAQIVRRLGRYPHRAPLREGAVFSLSGGPPLGLMRSAT